MSASLAIALVLVRFSFSFNMNIDTNVIWTRELDTVMDLEIKRCRISLTYQFSTSVPTLGKNECTTGTGIL
jgi:hypothetical protein